MVSKRGPGVKCPACFGSGLFELPEGEFQKCAEWDCNGTGAVMGFAIEVDGRERIESTAQLIEDTMCRDGR